LFNIGYSSFHFCNLKSLIFNLNTPHLFSEYFVIQKRISTGTPMTVISRRFTLNALKYSMLFLCCSGNKKTSDISSSHYITRRCAVLHTIKSNRIGRYALGITVMTTLLLCSAGTLVTGETGSNTITFTGKEDHHITLSEASQLTFNFRMQAGPNAVLGGFFGKEAILAILAQDGAVGLRYYYGLDEDGKPHIILIGVDKEGNDMVDGLLAQRSVVCPPIFAKEHVLNSPAAAKPYTVVLRNPRLLSQKPY
jgi:hypothetical protein